MLKKYLILLIFIFINVFTLAAQMQNYDVEVLGMQWIKVPSGEFVMGDDLAEAGLWEHPTHNVYLDKYYIAKYEITYDQYDNFCDDTGRPKPSDDGFGRGSLPVVHVTWYDCQSFCEWLSQKTGKTIHLPTEAQWEKAARGTDQRVFPWGNNSPNCNLLNYNYCIGKSQPVGSYPQGNSFYGLMDMSGNVWEWCQDFFGYGYYQECIDQGTVNNPQGPTTGIYRIYRGGSWIEDAWPIVCSHRGVGQPARSERNIGFRIVWEEPNISPTIICKNNVFFVADENCQAHIQAQDLVDASDPDGDSLTFELIPSGPFSEGTTFVTVKVSDGINPVQEVSCTVLVEDRTSPTIIVFDPTLVNVGKGKRKTANKLTVAARDNCSDVLNIWITKVEIFNKKGNPIDGQGVYEIIGNDIYVFPNGNGWSICVTVSVIDSAGNTENNRICKYLLN